MSGSDFTFNVAKGWVGYYASLPGASDSLIAVMLNDAVTVDDAGLKDLDTLADIVGAYSEASELTGYVRQPLTVTTNAQNDSDDTWHSDVSNIGFGALSAGETFVKLLICYKPSSSALDSQIIPLTAHSFDFDTNGSSVTVAVADFFQAID